MKRLLALSTLFLVGTLGNLFAASICPDFSATGPDGGGFADTAGCGTFVTVNADKTVTITGGDATGPFNGTGADTLIGLTNNTGFTLFSVDLHSTAFVDTNANIVGAFGFDQDGICSVAPNLLAANTVYGNNSCTQDSIDNGIDPADYSGVGVVYSNLTGTVDDNNTLSGTLTFLGSAGLADGQSIWFSLAGDIQNGQTVLTGDSVVTSTPEPGTILLFTAGLTGIAFGRRKFAKQ